MILQVMVTCWFGPGGLDSWNPLMKGIVTWGYPYESVRGPDLTSHRLVRIKRSERSMRIKELKLPSFLEGPMILAGNQVEFREVPST